MRRNKEKTAKQSLWRERAVTYIKENKGSILTSIYVDLYDCSYKKIDHMPLSTLFSAVKHSHDLQY